MRKSLPLALFGIVGLLLIILFVALNKNDNSFEDYENSDNTVILEFDDKPVDWYIQDDIESSLPEHEVYDIVEVPEPYDTSHLPQWLQDKYVFYPDDAYIDISVMLSLKLENSDDFQECDKFSRYDYADASEYTYTIGGVEYVIVIKGNKIYKYEYALENK